MFAGAQASAPDVRRVAVVGQNPLRLQIQTSSAAAPVAQMISGPDRLVIDIPNHIPAASLRGIAVNQGEVKGVRVSLFSTSPPVTRIVVDLNAPLQYRIVPNPSGLLVSLGNDPENSAATSTAVPTATTIGWVSPKASVKLTNAPVGSVVRKNSAHPAIGANSVSVEFANGLLSIHATGATLSEVLFQIQKKTGAEIAIPSGTEQDRVAADFGPGPAGEVLGELLNGSGLNFVVVGSESDPNRVAQRNPQPRVAGRIRTHQRSSGLHADRGRKCATGERGRDHAHGCQRYCSGQCRSTTAGPASG